MDKLGKYLQILQLCKRYVRMHVDCNERYENFRGIFKLSTVNDGLNFKTTFDHLLGKAWSELAQRHSEPCTGRMNKKISS